jgi:hypothetical protein
MIHGKLLTIRPTNHNMYVANSVSGDVSALGHGSPIDPSFEDIIGSENNMIL